MHRSDLRRPASAPVNKSVAAQSTRAASEDNDVTLVAPAARKKRASRPAIDRGTELMRRRTRKSPNHLIWAVPRSVLDRDPVAQAVQQSVSMYELGLKPESRSAPARRSGFDASRSSSRLLLQQQQQSMNADLVMATTPGGHVNTPASGRGRITPGAETPASSRTPLSAPGTPLIARHGSRSRGRLPDKILNDVGTPAVSNRQRPKSARVSGSASLLVHPVASGVDDEGLLATPGVPADSRELIDFKPFMNCSAARFVDFVLDPTVEPPRFAKPGERSASYALAEQRAPGPAQRAARHRERRRNGQRVRRQKAEREEAWIAAKIEDINRRQLRKEELLYKRDHKVLLAKQRGMLVQVALASRLNCWVSRVKQARAEKQEYWQEHRAALAIGAWFKTRKLIKNMKSANNRRGEACTRIQRWWRGILLYKWTKARQRAANTVVAVTRAVQGSGKLQELIRVFRYKVVRIQKSWRDTRLRQAAEVALCLRKWEKSRKFLVGRKAELQQAIANVKDERSIAQRERVAKREALEKELEALPKLPEGLGKKGNVPPAVMKIIAERWVRKNRADHKLVLRAYFLELDQYNELYAAMSSKLAARQAMGARVTGVEGMPTKPLKPFHHVLPSDLDVVSMAKASLKLKRA